MCRASQNMLSAVLPGRSKIRFSALLLCVCLIAAVLLSSAFILTHADHEHDYDGPGGSCAVCVHIMAAENFLKTLGTALISAALLFGSRYAVISLLKPIAFDLGFLPLVSLKIRLNN